MIDRKFAFPLCLTILFNELSLSDRIDQIWIRFLPHLQLPGCTLLERLAVAKDINLGRYVIVALRSPCLWNLLECKVRVLWSRHRHSWSIDHFTRQILLFLQRFFPHLVLVEWNRHIPINLFSVLKEIVDVSEMGSNNFVVYLVQLHVVGVLVELVLYHF